MKEDPYLALARGLPGGNAPTNEDADNPYLALIRQNQAAAEARLRTGVEQALASNPDIAAERQRLAQTSGLPLRVIERNIDAVRRKEQARAIDYVKMARESPVVARQLMDPTFTEVAVDDVSVLTQIEQAVAKGLRYTMGAAPGGGVVGDLKASLYRSAGAFAGAKRAAVDVVEPWARLVAGDDNWFAGMSRYYADQIKANDAVAESLSPRTGSTIGDGVSAGVQSFGQNAKYLPLALAGPGGAALALGGMVMESFGASYGKAADKNLPLWQKLGYASSDAMIEYWTEKIPMDALIGGIRQGAPFIQVLAKQLALEIPGEQLATVLQDLNEWATLNPGKPFADYVKERPDAAAQTLIATVIGTGGNVAVTSGVAKIADSIAGPAWRDNLTTTYADMLAQQLKLAGQSALRERSPEQFRAHVQRVVDSAEGASESVYVDGEVLNQLPAEVLNQLPESVREQIADAAATGDTVEIPMADVLTVAPGTPLEQVLNEHARMDPFASSKAEVAAAQDVLKQEAERVIQQAADAQVAQQEFDTVKAMYAEQIAATGRYRPAVAEQMGTWIASFYTAYGSRVGMTPTQFQQRYPVRVAGAPSTAPSAEQGEVMDQPAPEALAEAAALEAEARQIQLAVRARTKAERAAGAEQISDATLAANRADGDRAFALLTRAQELRRPPAVVREAKTPRWFAEMADTQRAAVDALPEWGGADGFSLRRPGESAEDDVFTSASSNFTDSEVVPGVRSVPLEKLGGLGGYDDAREQKRITALAERMRGDKEITPIFVGVDETGDLFIMEGQHRARAFKAMGMQAIPAKIVVDFSGGRYEQNTEQIKSATGNLDQPGSTNFDAWFGDSKVVDAEGKPLVVYHGTVAGGFDVFRSNVRKGEQLGFGVHFAVDPGFAGLYASDPAVARKGKNPKVYATYLKAEKPLLADTVVVEGTPEFALAKKLAGGKLFTVKDESGKQTAYLQHAIDATSPQRAEKLIREAGYDAVRYESRVGTAGVGARVTAKSQSWVVFRPEQIKSATGNNGNFDPRNPGILEQRATRPLFDQAREENFRRWSNDAPLVTSADATTRQFKTGEKVVVEAFHGTKRPDRVGTKFLKKRATSGPMAYHTSDPTLASSYATGKQDTSLSMEDQDYSNWFKVKLPGERSATDFVRSWYRLDAATKDKIAALAPRVTFSEEQEADGGNKIVLGDESVTSGTGSYDYNLAATRTTWDRRGNPLKALVEDWLNSGNLFNDEQRFMQVLKLAGFPMQSVEYDSPHSEFPFVYKNYIAMQKPLVTSDVPQEVKDALNAAAKKDRSRAQAGGADAWDKNTRTLKEWVAAFNSEDNTYVWTSIPDKVTEVFKSLGYDGIIDWSGKGGGPAALVAPVYIPFEETQVKSALGNKGTFSDTKNDILAQQAQTPRGTFNPRSLELVLNPNANLSTWFHETGHFFLEVMADVASQPGAPAQIVEDFGTFLKWAGITGDEDVGGADSGVPLGQQAEDADAVYQEIAADQEMIDALEVYMVSGDPPEGALNDKLVAYLRRLPPVPADSYLTFYRNQPRGVRAWGRGWASWTTNEDQTRFFGGRDFEVLKRKGAQGINLERLGEARGRITGDYHQYGSQAEWLLLNESVGLNQDGQPTPATQPLPKRRTPLETWNAMTLDQQRPYHERWAESIEQYVMEGKAPSVELQPLMRRFAAWLKSVYGSIKQFLAQRGVPVGGGDALNQRVTRNDKLAAWFGTGNTMVNEDGTPRVLYHGTTKAGARGVKAGQFRRSKTGAMGPAVYLGDSAEASAGYDDGAMLRVYARGKYLSNAQWSEYVSAHGWKGAEAAATADGWAGVYDQEFENATAVWNPENIKSVDAKQFADDGTLLGQDPNAQPGPALQLNDDIRRVMDRMLATDEQIQQANEVAGLVPDEAADGVAEERLRKRSIADLKWAVKARDKVIAKLKKEGRQAEKDVRAAVTAEVEALPVVQAQAALAEAERAHELDPFSADMNTAAIADAFGFASIEAMHRAIADFGDKAEVIDRNVERRLVEEHADLIDEAAIQEAANAAVHNEARARALAAELRSQKEMLNARTDTGETNTRGARITVNALVEAAKQFASNIIGRTTVKDLKARAWQHTAAERRAAKRWEELTAAGKTEEAVKAKQDQVLNHAAAKAAVDAQDEVRSILAFFHRVTKGNDEKVVTKGRDPDLVNAARAVLLQYGIRSAASKGAADYLDKVKQHDPATYDAIKEGVDLALQNAQPFEALTLEEAQDLHEQIAAMWHLAKQSRQMEVAGDMMDIDDAAQELHARMEEIGIPVTVPGESGAITRSEERGRLLQFAGALLRRTEQWALAKDGKYGGPFLRLIFQPVKDAADRYRADRVAYRRRFAELVTAVAPTLKHGQIAAPELGRGYTFGRGHNGIGMAELLHAILHTGNASNKRKLLLGRKWATENMDGSLDTTAWDTFLARLVTEGTLTKAHYDFAQGVWDLLEETKPLAQKTHRDVFGRYFSEVTAEPVVTPFGVYRGGYVPAQADPRLVQDAELRDLIEGENASMSYAFPSTNKGFTKARVDYNKPLVLDLRTLPQHLDKVLLFAHMEPAVRSAARLIARPTVSQPLGRIDPGAISGMLRPWLNRSARQQVETPVLGDGRVSKLLSTIRNRAGMALMFANISNTIQQVTGVPGAAALVKPSHLMRAVATYIAHPKQTSTAVWDASPYMDQRAKNEVAILADTMEKILLDPTIYESAQAWTQQHAYFMQSGVDNVLSPIVWTGAYNQAIEEGMTHEDGVRFADGVVRQTQGTTLPEDVSRIETGPPYARAFTQFMGYFNMLANTNVTALQQVAHEVGLLRGAPRALYLVTMGLLVPLWIAEAIAQVFRGGPEDEDKDGYLDDWLAAVFGFGTIKGLFATVPFVGQLANAAVNRANNNPVDDRVSLSPAVSLLEAGAGAPVSVYKAIVEDGNKRTAIRDVASLVSVATGLPTYAAARPLGYLAGVLDNRIDPAGPVDATRGLLTGSASPESRGR